MTRRTWQWMLGALLCGTLLPACTHSVVNLRCFGWGKAHPVKVADGGKGTEPASPDEEPSEDPVVAAQGSEADAPAGQQWPVPPEPQDRPDPQGARARFPDWNVLEPPEIPPPPEGPAIMRQYPTAAGPVSVPSIRETLKPADEPIVSALACLLKNDRDEALRYLKGYGAKRERLLLTLVPLIAGLTQQAHDQLTSEELGAVQLQLEGLLRELRADAGLVIPYVCLCEQINGYGSYKPMPPGHEFLAASDTRPGELVVLYVELRNLNSVQRGDHYETRLSGRVELHDGKRVWMKHFQDNERPLRSPTRRADYFRGYSFYVPHIPPGRYTLTIQVADETCQPHRVATKSVDFHISAGESGN